MRWKLTWLFLGCTFWLEGCLCLRGSDLVLQAKAKALEEKLNPTTEETIVGEDGNVTTVVVKKPLLTGIPQKDYVHDPNLPRELKGHNLTNYPFYNAVPEDIEFECDGLHDGFYASVPHHCQVYHHCLFGTRYDFLCANYTAFDQKTFICHFVSEVDCNNSPKYFIRNEALYKAASDTPPSTTAATTTTTTKAPSTTTSNPGKGGKRRRPSRRRRPLYDYYYDSEEYDEEYYDDELEEDPLPPPRKGGRKQRPHGGGGGKKEAGTTPAPTPSTTVAPASGGEPPLTRAPASVYSRNRVPPKIRPPVPVNERHKYEYKGPATESPSGSKKHRDREEEDEEYYDDEEYDDPPPPPPKKKNEGREKMNRRRQNMRKRPSRYEDDYEEEEELERPRMRKKNRKDEDMRRHRNRKGSYRDEEDYEEDDKPLRGGSRKRHPEETRHRDRRPSPPDEEYYDDEEEEERQRPTRKPEKRRTTTKKYERTTTAAPDEDYEEYEYEDEEPKPKKKEETTTVAPHRFSTLGYKNSKATSRPPVSYRRSKPTADPERKFRPLPKRGETSTEETTTVKRPIVMKATVFPDRKFTSAVGSPSGFKKQEEKTTVDSSTEPYKEEEKSEPQRRPLEGYRKQLANHRRQQESDKEAKEDALNRSSQLSKEDPNKSSSSGEKEGPHRTPPSGRGESDLDKLKSPPSGKDEKEEPTYRNPPPGRGEREEYPTRNPPPNRGEREEYPTRNSPPSRGERDEYPTRNSPPGRGDKGNPPTAKGEREESSYRGPSFPSRNEKEDTPYRTPPSQNDESNFRTSSKLKENINDQQSESPLPNNSRGQYTPRQNYQNIPSRSQDPPVFKIEEKPEIRNPPPREDYRQYRPFTSRGQESKLSEENVGSSHANEDVVQNGRVYPTRTTEAASSTESNFYNRYREDRPQNGRIYPTRTPDSMTSEDSSKTRYNKEEIVQNGRIYPTRSQDTSGNNDNNNYRGQIRDEVNYRNQMTRQEVKPTDNSASSYRNPYNQEERVNNYRNPTAVADEDYRGQIVSNEETQFNYRPQNLGYSNYRNPHASSDENDNKDPAEEQRYRLSNNADDVYQRPEVRWPAAKEQQEQQGYVAAQPSPQPPVEEVKPYITGPGADQSQDGKTGFPPAVTSPPRGYRRYNKKVAIRTKPVTEENLDYSKYPLPEESPKVEFTAPGPSAPQATPRPYLNLEEYDVTLNDALQPSTPYSRLKNRGYQSSVTQPHYRTGFLLTAASQAYPTKINGEYEAVVVPAPRFTNKRRPHEWYW